MATVSEDDLSEQFEMFGVTLDTNDPDIVDKCEFLLLMFSFIYLLGVYLII